MKFLLFILLFFISFFCFSQQKPFISIKKVHIENVFDKKAQELSNWLEKITYNVLDSLTKRQQHIFRKYNTNECQFIFLPKIQKAKDTLTDIFTCKVELRFTTLEERNFFTMSIRKDIFKNEVENVKKELETLLKRFVSDLYQTYIPSTLFIPSEKSIKNKAENKLNILFEQSDNNPLLQTITLCLLKDLQDKKDYFNLFWDKKDIEDYKNVIKLTCKIRQKDGFYVVDLIYQGKNMILKYPSGENIPTQFSFNKKRFDESDFSEFGYLVSPHIGAFVIMNK